MKIRSVVLAIFLTWAFFISARAHANHGPGTTGGGAQAISGETVKDGQFVFSLDHTYTNYEDVSRDEAERRAIRSGEFDAIRDAYIMSIAGVYGVTRDLQFEAQIGWYSGTGFIDASAGGDDEDGGHARLARNQSEEAESSTGSPAGLTDLSLRAKYRLLHGPQGHLAVIGGTILPVGKDDERLSDGERLEPSSQPGTGEFGILGGIAYSRYLTPRMTLDASSVVTHRFEHEDFRVGGRVDTSSGVAYRLTDIKGDSPQLSIFSEVNYIRIGRDEEAGRSNANSGGDTVYLTPGIRVRIPDAGTLALATSLPIYQGLNGDQEETDFRLLAQVAVSL
jgi:hypothetical protein